MKQKLVQLLNSNRLNSKPLFVFGNTEYTYEALKVLANNQITIDGIITSQDEVRRLKKIFGIDLCVYEKIGTEFQNEINILISVREYKSFAQLLYNDGFRVNYNLFVGFSIVGGLELLQCRWIEIKCSVNRIKSRFQHLFHKKIGIAYQYYKEYVYIKKGMKVYNTILKAYKKEIPILVYDYSGLGDVFVFCGLLAHNNEKIVGKEYVLTVIGGGSKKVAKMFDIENVYSLTNKESFYLSHFTRFLGNQYNVQSITPFSRVMYQECVSLSLAGSKINMLNMYKYVFLGLNKEDKFQYPEIDLKEDTLSELFSRNGLKPGNTVILSPYANTVIGYPVDFWIELSNRLKKKGYCVCTNCGGSEKEIPGTIRFSFELEIAEKVLDYAGYFIALRNGFCDIVCNSSAKKIFIYPIYNIFNSNVYEFCSFKKMGIGKKYIEIKWKYKDYEVLQEKILAYL